MVEIGYDRSGAGGFRRLDLMLRPSSRHSRSRILVSKGYLVRVSHVSVNPACRVSKWTESRSFSVTEWDMGEVRQSA